MSKKKKVPPETPSVPSVQDPVDPDALRPDAQAAGQTALWDMEDIWSQICAGSRKKNPSWRIAALLAQEFATRLESFLNNYPAEYRTRLAKEVIHGILYEQIRLETDAVE